MLASDRPAIAFIQGYEILRAITPSRPFEVRPLSGALVKRAPKLKVRWGRAAFLDGDTQEHHPGADAATDRVMATLG